MLSIDTSKAKALPGVAAVLTAEDIPGENKIGHLKHDQYTLIPVGGLTHYLGDAVALVAAEDMETVEKAKKLIKVEYEEAGEALRRAQHRPRPRHCGHRCEGGSAQRDYGAGEQCTL